MWWEEQREVMQIILEWVPVSAKAAFQGEGGTRRGGGGGGGGWQVDKARDRGLWAGDETEVGEQGQWQGAAASE